MYKTKDYIRNGVMYLNNMLRPSAQDAEYANVVFHNKMPIPLQALLNLAKASRASCF